jgi:DNA/RNA-binding domain of Phe-tRNA-synthetase-like protein
MFVPSERWKNAYPEAFCGVLAMRNVENPVSHPLLEQRREELRRDLSARYSGSTREELRRIVEIEAYTRYYRRFKKTYHVLLQLESVAVRGKNLPPTPALVQTMFMAELKNLLLTAAHDLDTLKAPVTIDVAEGSETYILLNGTEQSLKSGDMMISDQEGVISSIIYGPDSRSRITSRTRGVLYTVYAPSGIREEQVRRHLKDIEEYVRLYSPEAIVETGKVYCGS